MAIFLVMLASVGCSPQPAERFESPLNEVVSSAPGVIDLGIVFAQRGGQFVFPFEDFGLADSDEAISTRSECERVYFGPAHRVRTPPSELVWRVLLAIVGVSMQSPRCSLDIRQFVLASGGVDESGVHLQRAGLSDQRIVQ